VTLSPEKTHITPLTEGFEFLGHRVRLRWDDRWGYWPRIEIPTVRARENVACRTGVACSHVSGLFTQSGWTAGPDGVREPRPHHSSGIDVPMKRQVSLGSVGSTDCAITRHYSLASSSLAPWPTKPPQPWAGIPSHAASPPRRCAPSCSPAPPLPLAAADDDAVRSPTDRLWSPSIATDWRLPH